MQRAESEHGQQPLVWEDKDGDGFKIHCDEPGVFATVEVSSERRLTVGVYVDEADARALMAWLVRRLAPRENAKVTRWT